MFRRMGRMATTTRRREGAGSAGAPTLLDWMLERRAGLWELSAAPPAGAGRCSVAAALLAGAVRQGRRCAWVTPRDAMGVLPPDLAQAGLPLEALLFVRPPGGRHAPRHLARAAELLLRSGAFGWVVLDATAAGPAPAAWSSRLAAQAEHHDAGLLLLTSKPAEAPSAGPRVRLRLQLRVQREAGRWWLLGEVLRCREQAPAHHLRLAARPPECLPGAVGSEGLASREAAS